MKPFTEMTEREYNIQLAREAVARVCGTVSIECDSAVEMQIAEIEKGLDETELLDRQRLYRQGYDDAIGKIALAFGVDPKTFGILEIEDFRLPSIVDFRLMRWEF